MPSVPTHTTDSLLLDECFENNQHAWEETDSPTALSRVLNGQYEMINRTEDEWHFYAIETGLHPQQDFQLNATMWVDPGCRTGHAGLLWGVSNHFERFNRFALSASGERVVIMQADRNNRRVFHRFRSEEQPTVPMHLPIRFCLLRTGKHHHFFINDNHVCSAHNQHFMNEGSQVGFYVEPRMHIRAKGIQVRSLRNIPPIQIADILKT